MKAEPISACGDDLITVAATEAQNAQAIASALRASGDWIEVVAGINSVVVQFDAARIDLHAALEKLAGIHEQDFSIDEQKAGLIDIPIVYGGEFGPDFDSVCEQLEVSRDEFILLHTKDEQRVEMLGFTPGFAYIGELQSTQSVARLPEPRQHIAAGSIGIAGGQTGVYALQGPGGWPLIGRTRVALVDIHADEPFMLYPGARIRFSAIDESDT